MTASSQPMIYLHSAFFFHPGKYFGFVPKSKHLADTTAHLLLMVMCMFVFVVVFVCLKKSSCY